jgi:hypothetical protein
LTPTLFASSAPASSTPAAAFPTQDSVAQHGLQPASVAAAGTQNIVLSYSTYLPNQVVNVATSVDSTGSACVTDGTTLWIFDSTGNPTAIVANLFSTASILGEVVSRDENGNCFVAGHAGRGVTLQGPAFGHAQEGVAKFSPNGTLVYAVYFGSDPSNFDFINGIAVDSAGSAYIVGNTDGADFPTHNAVQNLLQGGESAFLVKLDPSGTSLIYSTFFGSATTIPGNAVTTDPSGEAFISGFGTIAATAGAFETSPGPLGNGYVAKFSATGALVYATYLSSAGTSIVGANGLAVDSSGSAYIVGKCANASFPTTPNAFLTAPPAGCNGTVSKLSADGSALVYSTYLGGTNPNTLSAIALDSNGNAYVVGTVGGAGFPLVNPIQSEFLPQPGSGSTLTLTALNNTGTALLYSTLFGGLDDIQVNSVAVDAGGNVYISGGTLLASSSSAGVLTAIIDSVPLLGASNSSLRFSACNPSIGSCQAPGFLAKVSPTTGTRMASPATVDFGVLALTSSTRLVIPILIQNMGTTGIQISNVSITGDYSINNDTCSGSISTAMHCEVDVEFKPTVGGTRPGTLTISSDAPDSPRNIALTGIGGVPQVSLSTTTLNLTSPAVGSNGPSQTVTVSNIGADVLNITALAIAGPSAADFSETHDCTGQLPVGASCHINVTYKASTSNTETAVVQLTDNAAGSPHTVNLIGVISAPGGVPRVSLSTTTLNLTSPAVGSNGPSQTVTVSNIGADVLNITALAIAGPSAADFSETHDCTGQLPVGASCHINVTYKASTSNTESAVVQLTDNAAGSPHTVNLTGLISALGLGLGPGMPSTLTVSAGQTATYNLVVGGPGFSGSVSLSCSGSPLAASCSVPGSVSVSSTPTSFQVVVTSTARSTTGVLPGLGREREFPVLTVAILSTGLLGLLVMSDARRRKTAVITFACLCVLAIAACGGGGGGTHATGTPAGTYALTVTANNGAGTTQSINLTLNVN